MDGRHFDALARTLTKPGSRRALLELLAALPIVGGLLALLDLEETDARGRRKRRKKRHKHGKGRRRMHQKRKKPCTPDAVTTTCAGRCGSVPNNCKLTVDCGACACTPQCEECFTCQAAGSPGTCVPAAAGTPCGAATFCSDGTLFPQGECDGDGNCFSSLEEPCHPYTQCDGDACATTCGSAADCVDDFYCDSDNHCVAQGEPGDACTSGEQCLSGFCVDDVCCASADCPVCQTCASGACAADASQDRSCCAGADGEQWCQAGTCDPIPAEARATLAECTGRCDCVPYPGQGCFGGIPAFQEICGASRLCPLCEQCAGLVSGCNGEGFGEGPAGASFYCVIFGGVALCDGGSCPHPESEVCLVDTCVEICQ